jgi:uncharacterized membrane protein
MAASKAMARRAPRVRGVIRPEHRYKAASPLRQRRGLFGDALGPAVPPRWVPVTTTVLSALAFADSAYLTYTHYSGSLPAGCPTGSSSLVNCAAVTDSVYSHPFGVPVAVAGLCWSAVMLALCTPWGWRLASRWASWARVAGSVAGVGMVMYLVWAELTLRHICEYCTGVHVLALALFVVVVFGTALSAPAPEGLGPEDERLPRAEA